jgi:hypothetical protein
VYKVPKRAAPVLLWAGFVLTAIWAIAIRVALVRYGIRGPVLLRPLMFTSSLIVANLVAFYLAMKVRDDYARGSGMRGAWLWIAAGCACKVVHYVFLWMMLGSRRPALAIGSQAANLCYLVLLVAGLIRMHTSFARAGLGSRPRWTDWLAIAAIAASIPLMFVLRSAIPVEMPNRPPAIAHLQQLDPLLIAACAIVGVGLFRTSRDIQSGVVARSLRYVLGFSLARLLVLLVQITPLAHVPWVLVPITAAGIASDWLVTMVVYYRWSLTRQATELAEQYQTT